MCADVAAFVGSKKIKKIKKKQPKINNNTINNNKQNKKTNQKWFFNFKQSSE